jgi:hypothetical protein
MAYHTLSFVILFILGGVMAFTLFWYLLGVGIGIAQRGYNRVAPYRIRNQVVDAPTSFQRRPLAWDDWEVKR